MSHHAPEDALVLRAVAPPRDAPLDLPAQLDWERVLRLAERHGVLGHLALLRAPAPAPVRARLEAWGREAAVATLRAEADLEAVAAALGEHRPVLLKGPALARGLFPEAPATRRYGDLDLLVEPAQVPGVHQALVALGYHLSSGLPASLLEPYVARGDELAYEHPTRYPVDLHWRLVDPTLAGSALAEAVRAGAGLRWGLPLPTPDPEATLVYLALHGTKHGWTHLFWLADVARALVADLDWSRVRRLAQAARAERALDLTRTLARSLLDVEAGPAWRPDPVAAELAAALAARPLDAPLDPGFGARLRYQLALRPRRRDRARLLWRMLATPSEHEWRRGALPPRAFGLYAVPRLARLLRKHLGGGED